jgi:hypothetical protein
MKIIFYLKKVVPIFRWLLTVIITLLAFSESYCQYVVNSWSIHSDDLSNGKIVLNASEVRSLTFDVSITRFYDQSIDAYPSVTVKLKLVRFANGSGDHYDVTSYLTVDSNDFGGGGLAEKSFTVSVTAIGSGSSDNSLLRNDDEIFLFLDTNQSATPNTSYRVSVALPDITGNQICCSQCLAVGTSSQILGQSSGTNLNGGDKVYTYQWMKSNDGVNFSTFSQMSMGFDLAKNPNYNPGTLSQTTWFRRIVGSTSTSSTSSGGSVVSNTVTIEMIPSTPLTIGTTTYTTNTTKKTSGSVTIQGTLATSSGIQTNIRSSNQVLVKVNSFLSPNILLSSSINCGVPNGRVSSDHVQLTTEKETVREDFEIGKDENLLIYPNPSNVETTFTYKVHRLGDVKLVVIDNLGKTASKLIDRSNVSPGVYEQKLNTSDLSPGIYFCELLTKDGREIKRLCIIK